MEESSDRSEETDYEAHNQYDAPGRRIRKVGWRFNFFMRGKIPFAEATVGTDLSPVR